MATPAVRNVKTLRHGARQAQDDLVPVEEPMEIRLRFGSENGREERSLAVTMRTPGQDFELAAGFLFTEGIVSSPNDIRIIRYCETVKAEEKGNVVRVELAPDVEVAWGKLQRNFYVSSSCGVCGKSSIEAASRILSPLPAAEPLVTGEVLHSLPERMKERQTAFTFTGGLHATGVFSPMGDLAVSREDVGRHNALDKTVGHMFLNQQLPLSGRIVLVSGRVSFELVQKCIAAGAPVLAAVGAPTSLALELAQAFGLTLVGFLRDRRFNVYTFPRRVT
jgi:FdhD protein